MLISVVTVNRNNARGLEKTIKSVIAQEKELYEYIIIDGASTDDSLRVIENYKSSIDFYVSEPDKGVYNAMNKSLQYTKGDYVIFLNSGDEFASADALRQIINYNLTEDIIFAGWNRKKGDKILATCFPYEHITLYELYYRSYCVSHQATFTRTEVLRELGGYDESMKISSDVCFLMKALIDHRKTYRNIPIVCANFDVTGMSGRPENQECIRQEKPAYFQAHYPNLVYDYERLHKYLRLKPRYIFNHIMWRLFGNER